MSDESRDENASPEDPKRWSRLVAYLKIHAFRALMSPEELDRHRRELEALIGLYDYGSDEGVADGDDFIDGLLVPWNPSRFPVHLPLFHALFLPLYYALDLFGQLFQHPQPPPQGRPLRVLRIASRLTQGGVAKVYLQSSLAMPKDRVEYTLWPFGLKNAKIDAVAPKLGIEMVRRKAELWPSSYRFAFFRDVFKASRIIRRMRADLVHVHEPQFAPAIRMAAALAGGVPVVVQLHSVYNSRGDSVREELLAATRHALRRSHLIACSATIRDSAARWLDLPAEKIALIEDGADDQVEHQGCEAMAADLKQAAGDRVIVAMMSHIRTFKRIDDFLYACRVLIDQGEKIFVLLMSYGKPKQALRLKRKFDKLFAPGEGQFLFQIDGPQQLLPAIDIGVSTSILEGLGLNVLEYQMARKPVLCTAIDAHKEMVEDGVSGMLFQGMNVAELARKLATLVRDSALRSRLGEAGFERANKRRWTDTAAATAAFYERALARPPQS